MEPIRLCQHKDTGPYGVWWVGDPAGDPSDFRYATALPRAEFDALVARAEKAEALLKEARPLFAHPGDLMPEEREHLYSVASRIAEHLENK